MIRKDFNIRPFDFIAILFVFLYIIFSFFSFLYGQLYFRVAAVFVIYFLLLFFFVFKSRVDIQHRFLFFWFVSACFFFSVFTWYSTGLKSLLTFLIMLGNFIAICSVMCTRASCLVLEVPFYILLVWILFLGAVLGYRPEEFNDFLAGSSRNVLSAILISLTVGYLVSRRFRKKRINLLPIFGQVFANLFLFGRTGIILSIFIFVVVLIAEKRFFFLGFVFFACIVGVVYFFSEIFNYIVSNTNFDSGFDTPRLELNLAYFRSISIIEVLFGRNLGSVEEYARYNGNPHNSLIRLHSHWGAGVFFVFLISMLSLFYLIKDREFLLLSLFFVVYLRSIIDVVYFFNLFDYCFYMIIFYAFFRRCRTADR